MWAYLKADWEKGVESGESAKRVPSRGAAASAEAEDTTPHSPLPAIDRTPKLFIGGKQVRPDQGYSRQIRSPAGALVGEVGDGNRKDIRNAVEAAQAAAAWGGGAGHTPAPVLYYVAENLSARAQEFAARIQ